LQSEQLFDVSRKNFLVAENVPAQLTFPGNSTTEMDHLNKLISKWMPSDSKRVAVDSHPRLSGIMDTINSTLAHGPETRLPSEFYDERGRAIIDKIGVEEWFSGYQESQEYRTVGIGALVGDIVLRMVGNIENTSKDGMPEVGGKTGTLGKGRGGEKQIKFAMSGCHDTTLAALLASLGAFRDEAWPPYTSHIALELFRKGDLAQNPNVVGSMDKNIPAQTSKWSLWSSIFGKSRVATRQDIARRPLQELAEVEKEKLDGYYVRVRYNDRPMTIPGCRLPGNHLEGDESFCTLVRS
jgi:acid phosphatase